MSEPLMDFACYVGKYEIKRFDELPEEEDSDPHESPNMPYLVQVGPAKLVRPKLDHLRAAVGLLLQTPVQKWRAASAEKWWAFYEEGTAAPFHIDAEELSVLKKNVLLIARHIGMLHGSPTKPETDIGYAECLESWVQTTKWIQRAFSVRDIKENYARIVGELKIYLVNRGHRVSMHIRPHTTVDALMYVAALEIARGTTFQACAKCGKPFLEGGGRDRRNKKRAGSRFCSDRCRYEYHNEQRRKAKAKS
jgi:hypothetical protein